MNETPHQIDVKASLSDIKELASALRDFVEIAQDASQIIQSWGFKPSNPTPPPSHPAPLLAGLPHISDANGSAPSAVESELVNGFDHAR